MQNLDIFQQQKLRDEESRLYRRLGIKRKPGEMIFQGTLLNLLLDRIDELEEKIRRLS